MHARAIVLAFASFLALGCSCSSPTTENDSGAPRDGGVPMDAFAAVDANGVDAPVGNDAGPNARCGLEGDPCCTAGAVCDTALSCVSGHCTACGVAGASCCPVATMECTGTRIVCDMGQCLACGGRGAPCCPPSNTCASANDTCFDGHC